MADSATHNETSEPRFTAPYEQFSVNHDCGPAVYALANGIGMIDRPAAGIQKCEVVHTRKPYISKHRPSLLQATLMRCPNLLALSLRDTRSTDATVAAAAAACPLLRALDLHCRGVTAASVAALLPLRHLHTLLPPPAAALSSFATLVAHLPSLRVLTSAGPRSAGATAPNAAGRSRDLGWAVGPGVRERQTVDGLCQTDLSVFDPHARKLADGVGVAPKQPVDLSEAGLIKASSCGHAVVRFEPSSAGGMLPSGESERGNPPCRLRCAASAWFHMAGWVGVGVLGGGVGRIRGLPAPPHSVRRFRPDFLMLWPPAS